MNWQLLLPVGLATFAALAALSFKDAPLDGQAARDRRTAAALLATMERPPENKSATDPIVAVAEPAMATVPALTVAPATAAEPAMAVEPAIAREPARAVEPVEAPPRAAAPATHKVDTSRAKPTPPPRARITVESRGKDLDRRIQRDAMRVVATLPHITGKIGVEARDAIVRLSGWTLTPGQSLRAEKAVNQVPGVKQVRNEIRPRMGAITS